MNKLVSLIYAGLSLAGAGLTLSGVYDYPHRNKNIEGIEHRYSMDNIKFRENLGVSSLLIAMGIRISSVISEKRKMRNMY